MGRAFRTALFGGFRKKDVIAYLEHLAGPTGFDGTLQSAQAANAAYEEDSARLAELERQAAEKQEEMAALAAQLGEAQDALAVSRAGADDAEARARTLESENTRLTQSLNDGCKREDELRDALQRSEAEAVAAKERVRQLEEELEQQRRRCDELTGQRWSSMEKQWQDSCRVLREADRRAQELTLAIRCEGSQRSFEDQRRADQTLEELRQELRHMSAELEALAHAVLDSRPAADRPVQSGRKLSSLDEILNRVSTLRGGRRDD